MLQTYTYSILNGTLNGNVILGKLHEEIESSGLVGVLKRLDKDEDVLDIIYQDALTAGDKTLLDGIVAMHSDVTVLENVTRLATNREIHSQSTINVYIERHSIEYTSPYPWHKIAVVIFSSCEISVEKNRKKAHVRIVHVDPVETETVINEWEKEALSGEWIPLTGFHVMLLAPGTHTFRIDYRAADDSSIDIRRSRLFITET